MEELKKFQSSTLDTVARRRLVEDQDTILELTGKIQDLQNAINCMNDSRDFQDAESVRSGNSHVTSQSVSFPPPPIPGGMLSRSIGMPCRKEGPPSIWDTHGISENVFAGTESMEFRQRRNDSLINSGKSRARAWGFSKMGSENLSQNRISRCALLRVTECVFLHFIVLWMLWLLQTRWLMNGAPRANVSWWSQCMDGRSGWEWWWWCVWLEGQEEGRREGWEWVVWAWVLCVGGRREEEGGRGREWSVIQDLFCLSHISRICFVAVCLHVFRHFHRTRKVFWILPFGHTLKQFWGLR